MTGEWISELRGKYPTLFTDECNCECPYGWRDLILEMCRVISSACPGISITDIREKFGVLEVNVDYPEGIDDAFRSSAVRILAEASGDSMRTCELCGKLADMCEKDGWLKVLCDKCCNAIGFSPSQCQSNRVFVVTKHAEKRLRERVGIPKSSCVRHALMILKKGTRRRDVSGADRHYMDMKYNATHKDGRYTQIIKHGRYIYVYVDDRLVTVLALPGKKPVKRRPNWKSDRRKNAEYRIKK